MEKLNLAGVVHRFIRPETVLLSSRRDRIVRLTAFDFAALYWDRERRAPVPLRGGASGSPLPVKLPEHLFCHLPPECFHADGSPYDGTHVDVWSVGVLTCQLLTGTAPFEQMSAEGAGSAQAQQLALWKSCEERRMMAEEFRTLLDDIFVEAEYRITIGEVAKDFRLTCTDRRELLRRKPTTYYRIDVAKVSFFFLLFLINSDLTFCLFIPSEHQRQQSAAVLTAQISAQTDCRVNLLHRQHDHLQPGGLQADGPAEDGARPLA